MSRIDELKEELCLICETEDHTYCKGCPTYELLSIARKAQAEAKLTRDLIEMYQERWEYVTESNVPGGVQARFLSVQIAYDRLYPKETSE